MMTITCPACRLVVRSQPLRKADGPAYRYGFCTTCGEPGPYKPSETTTSPPMPGASNQRTLARGRTTTTKKVALVRSILFDDNIPFVEWEERFESRSSSGAKAKAARFAAQESDPVFDVVQVLRKDGIWIFNLYSAADHALALANAVRSAELVLLSASA